MKKLCCAAVREARAMDISKKLEDYAYYGTMIIQRKGVGR